MSHEDQPAIREVWVVIGERSSIELFETEEEARAEYVDDKYRPAWIVRCEVSRTTPVAVHKFGHGLVEVTP